MMMMMDKGWCAFHALRLSEHYKDLRELYSVSPLMPPFPFETNYRCTEDGCLAHDIDEGTHEQSHDAGCDAPNRENPTADLQQLIAIIDSSGIPLISVAPCQSAGGQSLGIEVVRYEPGMDFIAISHVWADGLGSPTEASLPRCPVAHLRARILALNADFDSKIVPDPDGPQYPVLLATK